VYVAVNSYDKNKKMKLSTFLIYVPKCNKKLSTPVRCFLVSSWRGYDRTNLTRETVTHGHEPYTLDSDTWSWTLDMRQWHMVMNLTHETVTHGHEPYTWDSDTWSWTLHMRQWHMVMNLTHETVIHVQFMNLTHETVTHSHEPYTWDSDTWSWTLHMRQWHMVMNLTHETVTHVQFMNLTYDTVTHVMNLTHETVTHVQFMKLALGHASVGTIRGWVKRRPYRVAKQNQKNRCAAACSISRGAGKWEWEMSTETICITLFDGKFWLIYTDCRVMCICNCVRIILFWAKYVRCFYMRFSFAVFRPLSYGKNRNGKVLFNCLSN